MNAEKIHLAASYGDAESARLFDEAVRLSAQNPSEEPQP